MKNIVSIQLIGIPDANQFYEELLRVTNKFQHDGQEVEIQYSSAENGFSALVIGRK